MTPHRPPQSEVPSEPATPWWRFPMVWLVMAGPAAVVVAGLATYWIAARDADPIITESRTATASSLPAQQARNHAATAR